MAVGHEIKFANVYIKIWSWNPPPGDIPECPWWWSGPPCNMKLNIQLLLFGFLHTNLCCFQCFFWHSFEQYPCLRHTLHFINSFFSDLTWSGHSRQTGHCRCVCCPINWSNFTFLSEFQYSKVLSSNDAVIYLVKFFFI